MRPSGNSGRQVDKRRSRTRSAAIAAIQPRQYYLTPIRIKAMHYGVVAVPKWVDRKHSRGEPSVIPLLMTAILVIATVRGMLRASAQRHRIGP
jgi:hypothetical protein